MMELIALTRDVSPSIERCQLTYLPRQPIDVEKALEQHRAYERCLRQRGVRVVRLPSEPDCPDAVFVEDTAVVVDEIAIMARMGSDRRQPEVRGVAAALRHYRPITFLRAPARLDGGDVLRVGRTVYVGASRRTNRAGIEALGKLLDPYGYRLIPIEVTGCLHLKTACSFIGRQTFLVNRAWIETSALPDGDLIDVHPQEPWAANALLIEDVVLLPAAFWRTRRRLEARGFRVYPVDISEFQKAEGGLTCLSIILESDRSPSSSRSPTSIAP